MSKNKEDNKIPKKEDEKSESEKPIKKIDETKPQEEIKEKIEEEIQIDETKKVEKVDETNVFEISVNNQPKYEVYSDVDEVGDLLNILPVKGHLHEEIQKFYNVKFDPENVDKSISPELSQIYEDLFFRNEDFFDVYFHYYFTLKDRKYLIKYLIIDFFVKRRSNCKQVIKKVISELEVTNCFTLLFHNLFVLYNFEQSLKYLKVCAQTLQNNFFYHKKSEKFEKNGKYYIYLLFLKINDSKSFKTFFEEDLKEKENALILLNVFVNSKIKSKLSGDDMLVFDEFFEKPRKGKFINRVLGNNFLLKLNVLSNKVK